MIDSDAGASLCLFAGGSSKDCDFVDWCKANQPSDQAPNRVAHVVSLSGGLAVREWFGQCRAKVRCWPELPVRCDATIPSGYRGTYPVPAGRPEGPHVTHFTRVAARSCKCGCRTLLRGRCYRRAVLE